MYKFIRTGGSIDGVRIGVEIGSGEMCSHLVIHSIAVHAQAPVLHHVAKQIVDGLSPEEVLSDQREAVTRVANCVGGGYDGLEKLAKLVALKSLPLTSRTRCYSLRACRQ